MLLLTYGQKVTTHADKVQQVSMATVQCHYNKQRDQKERGCVNCQQQYI